VNSTPTDNKEAQSVESSADPDTTWMTGWKRLDSQGRLHLVYGSDTIRAVGVSDRGVLLVGIIAEQ